MRLTLLALLAAAGVACATPALASAHVLVGIGENNTQLFGDPRFLALGITQVRDDIPWNAIEVPRERAALTAWLDDARADGLTPLITFDHIVGSVHTQRALPSVARFSRAFRLLRAAFPWVTQFETWDEANFYLEGTAFNPRRAAQYYLALRRDCPRCTILAADLLDVPATEAVPMVRWVHAFIRYAHRQPGYWGLNNYFGANRLTTGTTERLLHAVTGKIWFAETGGIVKRVNATHVNFVQGAKHAAQVDTFIFHKLVKLSPRIQRVYLYEWKAVSPHDTWDSALISWTDAVRPAYDVLANTLAAWGMAPDCAISSVPPACASYTGTTGPTGPTASTLRGS
ncbi:MAG: hypothetical protein ABSC56_02120 [Solirubrobacteraceae bacterium]|jgi:hypothetical protein